MNDISDTISAISTAIGTGAVGIVRLSGQESLRITEKMFCSASGKKLVSYPPRTMVYGKIEDEDGEDVDEVLCVYMKSPHSYTAEDVVEIQCHGGVQSLRKILSLSWKLGARPAKPGEFTQRAFLNGRLDLLQAEAVMDIINARSQAALKNAFRQQEGYLSKTLKNVHKQLLDIIVHLEAVIDYPEEDIEEVTYKEIEDAVTATQKEIDELIVHSSTGKVMRDGLRTAIVGSPNVGKSSLLNLLLQEDRAIVSACAGTTRDVIEEQILVDDVPLLLMDTAGIHTTEDEIERMGIERSRKALAEAELVLAVIDGTKTLGKEDQLILQEAALHTLLIIINKQDLPQADIENEIKKLCPETPIVKISALTGEGLDGITEFIRNLVYGKQGEPDEGVYVENERQLRLLRLTSNSLQEARKGAREHAPYDCLTIDIREAIGFIGEMTGETIQDEILTQIFSRFCIGK